MGVSADLTWEIIFWILGGKTQVCALSLKVLAVWMSRPLPVHLCAVGSSLLISLFGCWSEYLGSRIALVGVCFVAINRPLSLHSRHPDHYSLIGFEFCSEYTRLGADRGGGCYLDSDAPPLTTRTPDCCARNFKSRFLKKMWTDSDKNRKIRINELASNHL